jgi:hypothetical protein
MGGVPIAEVGKAPDLPPEPSVEPGFPRAMVKRKPDSGPGYIAAANSQ